MRLEREASSEMPRQVVGNFYQTDDGKKYELLL